MQKKYGVPALIEAVKYRNIDVIKLLLENGADVNGGNETNHIGEPGSIIVRAADRRRSLNKKDIAIVKLLISYGADLNAIKFSAGNTLLIVALETRNVEFIRYLIKKGANVNKADKGGATALDYLAYSHDNYKKAEIIRILKGYGAVRRFKWPYRISS